MNDALLAAPGARARAAALCAGLSAALLFMVEPLFGRMLLPRLGGSAGVWTTCLCFFQATLLCGYLLAHLAQRLSPRAQVAGYALLLLAGAALLPPSLALDWSPAAEAPSSGLWAALVGRLGLPFLALSLSGPLIQAWVTRGGGAAQGVLAASNAGSLLGLLAYPFLLEPMATLSALAEGWSVGFLAAGLAICALGWTWPRAGRGPIGGPETAPVEPSLAPAATPDARGAGPPELAESGPGESLPAASPPAPGRAFAAWALLAFIPATLLYGLTTTLSTYFPPLPLLWVCPLALYLGGMVAAFARGRGPRSPRLGASVALCAAILLVSGALLPALARRPTWLLSALTFHLLGFGWVAFGLHSALAARGPAAGAAPAEVTAFNLAIGAGGLVGGVLGGVLAPLLFGGPYEYPLLLGLAICVVPAGKSRARLFALGLAAPLLLLGLRPGTLPERWPALLCALPLVGWAAWALRWRGPRVAGALVFLGALVLLRPGPAELYGARSLHGVHRVVDQDGFHHYLSSGVVHGRQSTQPGEEDRARAYFASAAPLGQVVGRWSDAHPVGRAEVVGLGIGGLLPYARADQRWCFWELDPAVLAIARDPALFTYLSRAEARGVELEVRLGDGRLGLAALRAQGVPPADLVILDAFCGDAVPTHLLTQEAFDLYAARCAPEGLLVFNISTRYLDLAPLVAAEAARLGWSGLQRREVDLDHAARVAGRAPSQCVVLAREARLLRPLGDLGWGTLPPPAERPWRDERASILDLLSLVRSGARAE